ncbi:hypothetical protein MRX96_007872 [Rhipicephalus microplus]
METFLSRYQRGCVAVFGADMDTAASNCTGTKPFERLKTLRALLGRTEGPLFYGAAAEQREKAVEKDLVIKRCSVKYISGDHPLRAFRYDRDVC